LYKFNVLSQGEKMRRALFFLLLFSFAFAQSSVEGALADLCESSRQMALISTILFLFGGVVLAAIGFVAFKLVKTENKIIRLIGMILIGLGIVVLVLAIIQFIIFLLLPFAISQLTGMPAGC